MNKKGAAPLLAVLLPALVRWGAIVLMSIFIPTIIGVFMGGNADSDGAGGALYNVVPTAVQNYANDAYGLIEEAKQETGNSVAGWFFGGIKLMSKYWWVFLLFIFMVNWAIRTFKIGGLLR